MTVLRRQVTDLQMRPLMALTFGNLMLHRYP